MMTTMMMMMMIIWIFRRLHPAVDSFSVVSGVHWVFSPASCVTLNSFSVPHWNFWEIGCPQLLLYSGLRGHLAPSSALPKLDRNTTFLYRTRLHANFVPPVIPGCQLRGVPEGRKNLMCNTRLYGEKSCIVFEVVFLECIAAAWNWIFSSRFDGRQTHWSDRVPYDADRLNDVQHFVVPVLQTSADCELSFFIRLMRLVNSQNHFPGLRLHNLGDLEFSSYHRIR
jgi:hypothetical protein